MNILDQIIKNKKEEVADRSAKCSLQQLQNQPNKQITCSFKNALTNSSTGIIAEFKRKSPSKGWIAAHAQVVEIIPAYAKQGASAVSVLTDSHFFGGSFADLQTARTLLNQTPILQKDFIVSTYQIQEAFQLGANVILLIAAALSPAQCQEYAAYAHSLGLETLLELHNEDELQHLNSSIDVVGINNRNLKTFEVDIESSIRLASYLPNDMIKVSESGLDQVADIKRLQSKGFKAFLMGEAFMKTGNPGDALGKLIQQLKL